MELATSVASRQRLQEVPVGVKDLPVAQTLRPAAALLAAQLLENLQGGETPGDEGSRHPGGRQRPPGSLRLQVLPQPEGGGPDEGEVPRRHGLPLRSGRFLLLPLVAQDGGEAGVGGRAGAFAFTGLEKVVQKVVLVVVGGSF